MDPVSIISGILGNLFTEKTIDRLVDKGIIDSLLKQVGPETIYPICLTILAYQVDESTVKQEAIRALVAMRQREFSAEWQGKATIPRVTD